MPRSNLPKQPEYVDAIDGIRRLKDEDEAISLMVNAFCDGPEWERFRRYFRSITIERVNGPGFDSESLFHLEGARWLMMILEKRRAMGKQIEGRPNVEIAKHSDGDST